LRGAALTCDALLSDPEDRDERFRVAIEGCGTQAVLRASAQLQYARRLVADGCHREAAAVLDELAATEDENVLGLARSARRDLARLGLEGRASDAPWVKRARVELQSSPGATPAAARIEVRLHGGLEVSVDGRMAPVPAGASTILLAVLAVRRSAHLEELVDLLWPEAGAEVGRRRMRNVLSRLRAIDAALIGRRGDRVALGPDVTVDEQQLEARAAEVFTMPPTAARRAAAEALLRDDRRVFLPEALYDAWADEARFHVEARRARLAAIAGDPT
jgi:hypothetical protein